MATGNNIDDILKKYGAKIESKINEGETEIKTDYSQSYIKFKEEMSPEISRYERWAKSLGNVIKLKISDKDTAKIQKV